MPASESRQPKARFLVRELGRVTWPDFVRIMEKHNGLWGGCRPGGLQEDGIALRSRSFGSGQWRRADEVDERPARQVRKNGRGADRVSPARRHAAKTSDRVGRPSWRRPIRTIR